MKRVFRWISLSMLIVAVIFLSYALTHPELGTVFYIGTLKIGSTIWRAFYAIYAVVMTALFVASFLIKDKNVTE